MAQTTGVFRRRIQVLPSIPAPISASASHGLPGSAELPRSSQLPAGAHPSPPAPRAPCKSPASTVSRSTCWPHRLGSKRATCYSGPQSAGADESKLLQLQKPRGAHLVGHIWKTKSLESSRSFEKAQYLQENTPLGGKRRRFLLVLCRILLQMSPSVRF